MNGTRIEPLQTSHAVEAFDCGDEALNRFLIRFALANQRARASRTYVALVINRKGLARQPDSADGVGSAGRGGGSPGAWPWRSAAQGRHRPTIGGG